MSLIRLQRLFLLAAVALAACGSSQRPQLKVLGIEQSQRSYDGRQIKLFVEVTNYARRPMRLARLDYEFGASGAEPSRGQVALSRTVDAGSAVVVEVPILLDDPAVLSSTGALTLRGKLITEQDQILRAYPVNAAVDEHATATAPVAVPDPAQ